MRYWETGRFAEFEGHKSPQKRLAGFERAQLWFQVMKVSITVSLAPVLCNV